MYARVNVWRGSIEETGLILFNTRDEAIDDIIAEINQLESDLGMEADLFENVMAQIAENRKYTYMTYICEIDDDPQAGRVVYFVLPVERMDDRRVAENLIREISNNPTGD